MKINLYQIIERAVFEGTALGITKASQDPALLDHPEKLIEAVADAVLVELCGILEFEPNESVLTVIESTKGNKV